MYLVKSASHHTQLCVTLLLLASSVINSHACLKRLSYLAAIPTLHIDSCNDFRLLGLLQGSTFAAQIRARVADNDALQTALAFVATPDGRKLLDEMMELHAATLPHIWMELQGIASGSELPVEKIFLLNTRNEFKRAAERAGFTGPTHAVAAAQPAATAGQHQASSASELGEGCSDVLVKLPPTSPDGPPRVLLGHNEDVASDAVGRMYFVRAQTVGHTWFGLCYAGELASTAFGANSAGLAYTLDALYPSKVHMPGLGRNFLSRAMLDASAPSSVIQFLQLPGQATGRSVNVLDYQQRLLYNVEVAPGGASTFASDVLAINESTWHFHANAYQRLAVKQLPGNSSAHREATAAGYAMPSTAAEVLDLLGDHSDLVFPIFRTAGLEDGGVSTACTVLVELPGDGQGPPTLTVYQGNPRLGQVVVSLDLLTLNVRGGQAAEQPLGNEVLHKAGLAQGGVGQAQA